MNLIALLIGSILIILGYVGLNIDSDFNLAVVLLIAIGFIIIVFTFLGLFEEDKKKEVHHEKN